jgi:hypothetical protein
MPFPSKIKQDALLHSRRSCCLCGEYAGRATDVHHIIQEADGGPDTLDNAAVLCLRCHGEVGHYNPRHPIGNKLSPDEVRKQRDLWWDWCAQNPHLPLPKHPISLSHGLINIVENGWKRRGFFKIINRSPMLYHHICVKITIELRSLRIDDIEIKAEDTKFSRATGVGSIEVDGRTFMIGGTDHNGMDAILIYLIDLDPGGIETWFINVKSGVAVSASSRASATVSLASFHLHPGREVLYTDEAVSLPFEPPEGFTIRSMAMKMRNVEHAQAPQQNGSEMTVVRTDAVDAQSDETERLETVTGIVWNTLQALRAANTEVSIGMLVKSWYEKFGGRVELSL